MSTKARAVRLRLVPRGRRPESLLLVGCPAVWVYPNPSAP